MSTTARSRLGKRKAPRGPLASKLFKAPRQAQIMVPRNVMGVDTRPGVLRANTFEVKALDVPSTFYAFNTTAVVTPLSLIQTGSSFFNRIGRRIEMKNVRVSGSLQPLRTVANQDYLRLMIIYDRQTNGALPALADILQTTSQTGANSNTALSGVNLNNRDRFVILRDLRIAPPSQTDTAGVITNLGPIDPITTLTNIDLFVRLKGLICQYKADSSPAVIGDIATGGLFLVTFGLLAPGAEGWQAALEIRLRFFDR